MEIRIETATRVVKIGKKFHLIGFRLSECEEFIVSAGNKINPHKLEDGILYNVAGDVSSDDELKKVESEFWFYDETFNSFHHLGRALNAQAYQVINGKFLYFQKNYGSWLEYQIGEDEDLALGAKVYNWLFLFDNNDTRKAHIYCQNGNIYREEYKKVLCGSCRGSDIVAYSTDEQIFDLFQEGEVVDGRVFGDKTIGITKFSYSRQLRGYCISSQVS